MVSEAFFVWGESLRCVFGFHSWERSVTLKYGETPEGKGRVMRDCRRCPKREELVVGWKPLFWKSVRERWER